MCLILLSWRQHPPYRLAVAANRDEFRARPTAPARFWEEAPSILAGRDLEAGGTWMGVSREGRFAALTNFRRLPLVKRDAPSRGRLVVDFLGSDAAPREFLEALRATRDEYAGFSIFVSDAAALCYFSNIGEEVLDLAPGVYGLSNHLLDTAWPKVDRGKTRLNEILTSNAYPSEAMFELLADRALADDRDLPNTGVGLERERALSPIFISDSVYGTRSSTVLLMREDGTAEFEERTFGPDASLQGEAKFRFSFNVFRSAARVFS